MPRPRFPPTPLNSTDLTAQNSIQINDMEGTFTLPPPAIQASSQRKSVTNPPVQPSTTQVSPPLSPERQIKTPSSQRKRTLSGGTKPKPALTTSPRTRNNDSDLPPPPSRARKIIQMKPKQPIGSNRDLSGSAEVSTDSKSSSTAPVPHSIPKRKSQPSSTSAAGRKIARKTAHSIIERRRRSKMNEEFGVLKDMIPACAGVEMHKLAILQAGIEYVRYLEGCVDKLKAKGIDQELNTDTEKGETDSMDVDIRDKDDVGETSSIPISEDDSADGDQQSQIHHHQQELYQNHRTPSTATSATASTHASPNLRPNNSSTSLSSYYASRLPPLSYSQSIRQTHSQTQLTSFTSSPSNITSRTPNQSGISPAMNAFQFSPDLTRTSTWSTVHSSIGSNPSPNILPLPQAALAMPIASTTINLGGHAEATATAALMMLTKDRRGSISTHRTGSSGKGMSVKDLLSS